MNSRRPVIELLFAGTELLSGKPNTHLSFLAQQLRAAGLKPARAAILPDEREALGAAIRSSTERADAVIVFGGLGPTFDDVTREAASAALGRDLVFTPKLYAAILRKFSHLKIKAPAENRRQAFLLRGAKALTNRRGSAPGQLLILQRKGTWPQTVALLPGPLPEMEPMWTDKVLPHLRRTYARHVHAASLELHLCGIPESAADEKLRPLTRQAQPGLDFTILISGPAQIDFYALASAASAGQAKKAITRVRREALRLVGPHVFGEGSQTLESVVGDLLKKKRQTLAVAESCTAGLLAARLTSVPGSSDYFRGGILAYHNDLKMKLLGVSAKTLARHGAVSAQCAAEMAEGARRVAQASLGLAVTGIAGPSGAMPGKPVGLVFIALANGRKTLVQKLQCSGDRTAVRQRAATEALRLLWGQVLTFD